MARTPIRPTIDLGEVRDDDDRAREGDEGDAALHGAVAEDVLQVQREQEELGERDGADDRHRDVRGSERPPRKSAQRQERPRRARLECDERREQRRRTRERRERRRSSVQPSVVARVSA